MLGLRWDMHGIFAICSTWVTYLLQNVLLLGIRGTGNGRHARYMPSESNLSPLYPDTELEQSHVFGFYSVSSEK